MEYFGNTSICHFNLLDSHILGCSSGQVRPLKHRWKNEICSITWKYDHSRQVFYRHFRSFLKVPNLGPGINTLPLDVCQQGWLGSHEHHCAILQYIINAKQDFCLFFCWRRKITCAVSGEFFSPNSVAKNLIKLSYCQETTFRLYFCKKKNKIKCKL